MHSQRRILIVDDLQSIRDLNVRVLGREYVTACAASGDETLALLPVFRPELVLLDVNMPVMDGLETCRLIRKDPAFRFTKIIFVSGMVTLPDRLAGYEAGGDDYISKPCNDQELMAKVRILLRLKTEEELHALKSDFIGLVTHELRTPMNGILGFAELLQQQSSGEVMEMAGHILQSGRRLFNILDKIMLFTEFRAVKELKKRHSLIVRRINALINGVENRAAHNLLLSGNGDFVVSADWFWLEKAFSYLLENAIKFSPPGGRIDIETAARDNECRVRIANQGDGINPGLLTTIFDEFCIRNVAHHQQGIGISLAFVKEIVELHGGRVFAENVPGGAVFTVCLPIVQESQVASPPSQTGRGLSRQSGY